MSVVIPAMNEAANLPWVLSRLDRDVEVVLVDGGSTDDTVAVTLQHFPDAVVVDQTHPGKGAALAQGMLAAHGDYIVMIDADGSMDPVEIAGYVGLLDTGIDVVKGSRYLPGAGSEDITWLRSAGNKGLTVLANILFRLRWSELCYGFAAFRKDALADLDLVGLIENTDQGPCPKPWTRWLGGRRQVRYGHGFEIETILFTRAARAGLRVAEVPSFERDRMHGTSNLSTFRDGARVLTAMFWERRPSVWRQRRTYTFSTRPDAPAAT